jgi:hypothetical protein
MRRPRLSRDSPEQLEYRTLQKTGPLELFELIKHDDVLQGAEGVRGIHEVVKRRRVWGADEGLCERLPGFLRWIFPSARLRTPALLDGSEQAHCRVGGHGFPVMKNDVPIPEDVSQPGPQ